jgi:hypothetical protein
MHSIPCPAGAAPLTVDAVVEVAGDEMMEWLDAEHGAEVSDQRIFREHAERYEVSGIAGKTLAKLLHATRQLLTATCDDWANTTSYLVLGLCKLMYY